MNTMEGLKDGANSEGGRARALRTVEGKIQTCHTKTELTTEGEVLFVSNLKLILSFHQQV